MAEAKLKKLPPLMITTKKMAMKMKRQKIISMQIYYFVYSDMLLKFIK